MALSAQLGGATPPLTPESISTTVTLSLDKLDSGWTITASHIDVVGKVPGADAATFQKYAEAAEKGCPVSKVLNAKITMTATLG
jgi:osmotically inducible protein OsmC